MVAAVVCLFGRPVAGLALGGFPMEPENIIASGTYWFLVADPVVASTGGCACL